MKRWVWERSGFARIFICDPHRANPSGIDVVEHEVFKCAGVWVFPNVGVSGRGESHPKCGALLSQPGVHHIFENVNSVLLGFNLVGVQGHGDVVEGLVDETEWWRGWVLDPRIQRVDEHHAT